MAEIAVLAALQKIAMTLGSEALNSANNLLAKKAKLLASMKQIEGELQVMKGFLSQNAVTECKDLALEAWIRQARMLAYRIEDVVDEFLYIVDNHNKRGCLENFLKKPKSLISLCRIASELENIKTELTDLSKRRDNWVDKPIGGFDVPRDYSSEGLADLSRFNHSIDEEELVGFDDYRKVLTGLLKSDESELRVITLWGLGGVGKSTLANNVYKREGHKFDCRAFVSISESFKIDDILRKILTELYEKESSTPFDVGKMDTRELKEKLRIFLEQKRYLIVLDDMWSPAPYFGIRDALIDANMRSRIVITTRIDAVASLTDHTCKLELRHLSEDMAWELFCKKAFSRVGNHECPPDLEKLAKQIVKKCHGLPLALVAIGSLMFLMPKTEIEWKRVNDQLIWEFQHNPNLSYVEKILNLSYYHLPAYLKNCFLYCSLFPEDYLLPRKRLIRLWIAEGFVEKRGASSLEEVAYGYLSELTRLSMLQIAQRNSFGRIQRCRMHDLVRELAISIAAKESFNAVYDDSAGTMQQGPACRRVSVLRCTNDFQSSINPSRLRTSLMFDNSMPSFSWSSFISSKSRYLAVLDLSGTPIEIIPVAIGDLFNLKYLSLCDTSVNSLPDSVAKLCNLQTLELSRSQVVRLPRGIAKLKKLRHLLVWRWDDQTMRGFSTFTGVQPFEGLWSLMELQALNAVQASRELIGKLGNLSQLRCLCISKVRSSHCAQLCSSLSQLRCLSRLEMIANSEDEVLQLVDWNPPPPHLQKLELTGRLADRTLECPFFSSRSVLKWLDLRWCQLAESPLPHLSNLSSLTHLALRRAYNGQQLTFRAGWFPNLRDLFLRDLPHVNRVEIEEAALVSLAYLQLGGLKELKEVPIGIEFLPVLREVYFYDLIPEFEANLHASIALGKLARVRQIYFR